MHNGPQIWWVRCTSLRSQKKRLAEELGVTPEYVSMVLNGHREPAGAEKKFSKAVEELIAETQREDA